MTLTPYIKQFKVRNIENLTLNMELLINFKCIIAKDLHWEYQEWKPYQTAFAPHSIAWSGFITDSSISEIIKIAKSAMNILNPDISYENGLVMYDIPHIEKYIDEQCPKHYHKIISNEEHPLRKALIVKLGCQP